MKKILAIAVLALAALTMNAKEISKNCKTGMSLVETEGVYSLKADTGIIILGDLKTSRNFMFSANTAFSQKMLEDITSGEDKFKVQEDEDGLYIVKVGLGAMKIRPGDTAQFLAVLEGRLIKDKAGKVWKVVKE